MTTDQENKIQAITLLLRENKYEQALSLADSLIKDYPSWFYAYYEKADVYARQDLWDEALEYIDQAILLRKDEPALYHSKGWWQVEAGHFAEAIETFTYLIFLEKKLNDVYYLKDAYFFRAIAFSQIGNYENVLSDCSQVHDDYRTYTLNKLQTKAALVTEAKKQLGLI